MLNIPPVQGGIIPEASPARCAPIGVRLSGQAASAPDARRLKISTLVIIAMAAGSHEARATELWSDGDGSELQWDNTLQQTEAFRTTSSDPVLLSDANADDGDRRFKEGLFASRSDLLSELDGSYRGDLGFRTSVAAWLDPLYLLPGGDENSATFNPVSVSPRQFPAAVKQLQGLHVELFDAFVHDTAMVGNVPVSLRVGRYTLLWGESLFFGGNGIASGQAPLDILRAREVPNSTAKDLFLPLAQASASAQLGAGLSVEAYEQFEWRSDRLPGVSTYFSTTDVAGAGAERLFEADGASLIRRGDQTPAATGQFGVALRGGLGQTDWGLYALRGGDRDPLVQIDPSAHGYRLIYPGGIDIFGASTSGVIGSAAVAGEVSLHTNVPVGRRGGLLAGEQVPRDDSINAQASITSQLTPGRFWDAAQLLAELAGNTVLDASANADGASSHGRSTAALEAQFAPQYYRVLPALNVDPTVTISYGLVGSSAIDPEFRGGAGAVIASFAIVWRTVWHAQVQYTRFIGSPSAQPLADRDFAAISLQRSF